MDDTATVMRKALHIAFEDLTKAIDALNNRVKSAVPAPPLLTPPRPKMIGPGWIIGIQQYQVPAISADRYSNSVTSWLPRDTSDSRQEQVKAHMPRIHAYRPRLLHAIPHLPPPSQWQALVNESMEYDAIGSNYYIEIFDELVCCSLRWNPVRVRRSVEAVQSLTNWCYRMIDHINQWCRRRLEQPDSADALEFLNDILVEHSLREGKA